jgi:hypothetical protein
MAMVTTPVDRTYYTADAGSGDGTVDEHPHPAAGGRGAEPRHGAAGPVRQATPLPGAGGPLLWQIDADRGHVERWTPGDRRPSVVTDRLVWRPTGAPSAFEMSVAVLQVAE